MLEQCKFMSTNTMTELVVLVTLNIYLARANFYRGTTMVLPSVNSKYNNNQ